MLNYGCIFKYKCKAIQFLLQCFLIKHSLYIRILVTHESYRTNSPTVFFCFVNFNNAEMVVTIFMSMGMHIIMQIQYAKSLNPGDLNRVQH